MERIYDLMLAAHLEEGRQMAFVSGPRQVGKTTTCRAVSRGGPYLSWDDQDDRALVLRGPTAVARQLGLDELRAALPIVVLDELHKYRRFKTFLKGLFDGHADHARFVVTGSSRLEVYRRGGDSLMGRYLPYRMHPLTVSETVGPRALETLIAPPRAPDARVLEHLLVHGGFPEPFLRANDRFTRRWRTLRREQFVRDELRDLTRVAELGQMAVLVELLTHQAGALVNLSNLARQVNVAVDTVRRWVALLESLHVVFLVRPWFRNVAKSLRKQPKAYLWDWSSVPEPGPRLENLVASHLLKAIHGWIDLGMGEFSLHFVRDTAGREVDFLVARDRRPWFLVEVKSSDRSLHAPLAHFQAATGSAHAFQAVGDLPFVGRDCFEHTRPLVVPAATLLSQLL